MASAPQFKFLRLMDDNFIEVELIVNEGALDEQRIPLIGRLDDDGGAIFDPTQHAGIIYLEGSESETDYSDVNGMTIDEIIQKWKRE